MISEVDMRNVGGKMAGTKISAWRKLISSLEKRILSCLGHYGAAFADVFLHLRTGGQG